MKLFNTILIPVDFTINTKVAVCKALELADADDTAIHLLHIFKPSFTDVKLGKSAKTEKEIDAERKLNEWQLDVHEYKPHSKVICWIEPGFSIERGIVDKAFELSPDLIVIGKNVSHSVLPLLNTVSPSRISKRTGKAVLTVKPGSLNKQSKHVVVPVTEAVAQSKINIVTELCKNNRIKISLVAFANDESSTKDDLASSLLQIYQKLKATSLCRVDYALLKGQNRVKALLQFAENNEADILLLEPYSETKIGWPDKHISDVIAPDSKVQVLTV